MKLARKVLETELSRFEQHFDEAFSNHVPLLDRVLRYIAQRKGKQLRPMFVLLCARLGGPVGESSYRAALFVEMLHTSSLVHDDLVDDSLQRRGAFSINALWKNRIAVLTGDNLFTKSVLLLLEQEDHRILKIFSGSIGKIIEGELLQFDKSRKLNQDEQAYYEVIKNKTATLLAAACAAGAASTSKDDALVEQLYKFGEKAGIAFQIKDDLLDYGEADIGKPTGNDIKERKLTLPLIYTLNSCDGTLRKQLLYVIKYKNTDKRSVAWLVDKVKETGGMVYAENKMLSFRDEALQLLQAFPASDARAALEELVRYATDRNH